MRCKTCNCHHLILVHEVSERVPERPEKAQDPTEAANSVLLNTTYEVLYVDRPAAGRKVLLKLSKVLLRNGETMEAFRILDDGSERAILHAAAQHLGLKGQSELTPATEPKRLYHIRGAFTAK